MYAFKDAETFTSIVPYLLNRIADRHSRFHLFSHFSSNLANLISKTYKQMHQAYFFSFWNPTNHYTLNLSNKIERDIAITLLVLNKEYNKLITADLKADRS